MLCLWTWQSAPMAHHTTATEAVDLRTKKDRQVHTARPTAPEAVDALTDTVRGGSDAASPAVSLFQSSERLETAPGQRVMNVAKRMGGGTESRRAKINRDRIASSQRTVIKHQAARAVSAGDRVTCRS